MPRKPALVPTEHLHIKLDTSLRAKMDLFLFSALEGRVPKGGHKAFIEARLRDFFEGRGVTLPSGLTLRGSPEAVEELRRILAERRGEGA